MIEIIWDVWIGDGDLVVCFFLEIDILGVGCGLFVIDDFWRVCGGDWDGLCGFWFIFGIMLVGWWVVLDLDLVWVFLIIFCILDRIMVGIYL